MTADLTLVLAILMAFAFALTNGFHDAANSIATLVATRVARPLPAVAMASVFNLIGPLLFGAAVANTVGKLVTVDPSHGVPVIGAGLTGAVIWNTYTWRRNLPSSSSHALIGGLTGAVLASTDLDFGGIYWSNTNADHWYQWSGILWKIGLPMVISPFLGFICGYLVLSSLYLLLKVTDFNRKKSLTVFSRLQILSAGSMGFMHGTNDAQKTIGLIFLAILTLNPELLSDKEGPLETILAEPFSQDRDSLLQ